MPTERDIRIIKDGLQEAAVKIMLSVDLSFENSVFPIWRKTMHTLLKEYGCPCKNGKEELCFLHLKPEEQQERFRDTKLLSFKDFCSVLQEGLIELPTGTAQVA